MAFIDSEIAKRRQGSSATQSNSYTTSTSTQQATDQNNNGDEYEGMPDDGPSAPGALYNQGQRQPATMGKIQEIELDSSATADSTARRKKVPRVRLGPDGKPWRGRKRRGSEDVKRDSIVEQVLRENKIEMYEEPEATLFATTGDGENDDRIAEEFKREYLDAASQRNRKKPVAPPPTRGTGGRKVEEEMKGPKLGGSRSQRLKMQSEMKAQAAHK